MLAAMGLSTDPEKRARQEAGLRKGNPKAFTKARQAEEPAQSQAPTQTVVQAKPRAGARRAPAPSRKPARERSTAPASTGPTRPERQKGFLDGLFGL